MRIIVDRGRQPGSVMGYLLRTDKRERGQEEQNPVFHTNMFGETEPELTEELRFAADQNERVERTYVQYKISFPPGENPDLETKKGIVDDVLTARGHGQHCQFLAVEHFEKIDRHDVHHLHVLASTVRLDGSWVDDAYERVKLKDVERQLETKWGLQDCPPQEKRERINTPIGEVKLREQGQTLTKDTLRAALNVALADQPSMPLLMARIKAQGYTMQFHEFDDGKGVSFGAEGRYFKGRQLGDRFSFKGLHEYAGVDYQPERDDPMLRVLNEMGVKECREIVEPSRSSALASDESLQLQELQAQHRLHQWAREQAQAEKILQAQEDYYRDRYEHYSPQVELAPGQQDVIVAGRALRDGQKPEEAVLIVAQGKDAQALEQAQGRKAALAYAVSVTQQAVKQREQVPEAEQKKERVQSRSQEQER